MKKPARHLPLATVWFLTLSGLGAGAVVTGENAGSTPTAEEVLSGYRVLSALDIEGEDIYFMGAPQGSRDLFGDRRRGVRGDLQLLRLPRSGGKPTPILSEEQEWEYRMGDRIVGSHETQRIAFVSRVSTGDSRRPTRIVVCDLRTGNLHVVDNGMSNLEPTFSPDGTQLAFYSASPDISTLQDMSEQGYTLHVFDIETGQETVLSEPSRTLHVASPPAWSPNGEQLAFLALFLQEGAPYYTRVYVVRANGEDFRTLIPTERYEAGSVAWPNRNTILFTGRYGSEAGIHRVSLPGDLCETIGTGFLAFEALSLSPDRRLVRCTVTGEDRRPHERVFTLDGRDVTSVESHRLFRGQWRLTSRRASP